MIFDRVTPLAEEWKVVAVIKLDTTSCQAVTIEISAGLSRARSKDFMKLSTPVDARVTERP
ncbi:hypothetical protein SK128_017471 [Halocaridina rubra]|uniref:Uncharacterized protein n=1 Tax=Halocaridina rubra TaxID=373956 RepID=A0AAN8XCF4_HALRR